MSIETTYSQARAELASLMTRVTDDREIVVVKRRDHPAVAMIAADELASLLETAHLLRSPANAQRLLAALGRARANARSATQTVASLREQMGLARAWPSSTPAFSKTCAIGSRPTAERRGACSIWSRRSCATRSTALESPSR